ncbi:MAG: glycoside hydrolase family 15 protein [Nitrococcus sp.]|nr:glycoside hydrolase family 15 protein [Nitrococcus sp.]
MQQPPIKDYALIADGQSAALVSKEGSIDWCCLARIDAESCFSRLLDWEGGGACIIQPVADHEVARCYLDRTMVLETRFHTPDGEVCLRDFLGVHGPDNPADQLIRIVEGISGEVALNVEISPRFCYGQVAPWIRCHGDRLFTALGGDRGLVIYGDVDLERCDGHDLRAQVMVRQGERLCLGIHPQPAYTLYPAQPEAPGTDFEARLEEAIAYWRDWASQCAEDFAGIDQALRSALIIKSLIYHPSGAIAAAATSSLPEQAGGRKNWDYRFSWIRDSAFAIKVMSDLGFEEVARGFRYFIERTTAGSAEDLQPIYGLDGGHILTERKLQGLAGYRGADPVRIGNAAESQKQLDIYGELLEVAFEGAQRGPEPDREYWHLLRSTVELVETLWQQPDEGIWESRGESQHYTHSKVMCWVAVERMLKLAAQFDLDVPVQRWRSLANNIRQAVENRGYDHERGVFVRAFGSTKMDCALLLLPRVGFIDFRDERMMRTVDEIRRKLEAAPGLFYRHEDAIGEEGAFIACSFWLVECLVEQGRDEEARKIYQRVSAVAGDLGLFSEMADPDTGELLGNLPQGLSHYSHISATMALGRGRGAGQGD